MSVANIVLPSTYTAFDSEVLPTCIPTNGTLHVSAIGDHRLLHPMGVAQDGHPMSWADMEDCPTMPALGVQIVDISTLVNSTQECTAIIDILASGSDADKHALLLQLHPIARQLALSKSGCRIVQKALEVAGGLDRDVMIAALKEHVVELYESPHGNHVLSRAIEVLPASKIHFIISAVLGRGLAVSKHRFGCRIICRLVEHCGEEAIGELLDEVLAETDELARHAFGNFVVQTAMEHASPLRRSAMLSQLLPGFAMLAMHRTGSLVAQRVLDYCDDAGQNLAIQALVRGEGAASIVDIACNRYGSYVLEQLAGIHHSAREEAARILARDLHLLQGSEYAEKVTLAFGLSSTEQLALVA